MKKTKGITATMTSENTWNVTFSHRKCEIIKRCLTAVNKMKGVTAMMTYEITWISKVLQAMVSILYIYQKQFVIVD